MASLERKGTLWFRTSRRTAGELFGLVVLRTQKQRELPTRLFPTPQLPAGEATG